MFANCKLSFDTQEGDGVIVAFDGPAGRLAMGRTRLAKRCGGGIDVTIAFVLACRYALATTPLRARLVLLRCISSRVRSSSSIVCVGEISCHTVVSVSCVYVSDSDDIASLVTVSDSLVSVWWF